MPQTRNSLTFDVCHFTWYQIEAHVGCSSQICSNGKMALFLPPVLRMCTKQFNIEVYSRLCLIRPH